MKMLRLFLGAILCSAAFGLSAQSRNIGLYELVSVSDGVAPNDRLWSAYVPEVASEPLLPGDFIYDPQGGGMEPPSGHAIQSAPTFDPMTTMGNVIQSDDVESLNWIPFEWVGGSVSGRYSDKLAINIPVSIDGLPHKFKMQFDLGAVTTVIYGNSIDKYLDKYPKLKNKLDSTTTFIINGQENPMFNNVGLSLGNVSFGKRDIGYFKDYGEPIPTDSISTSTQKLIGTIAPDLFKDKYLIVDYPNQRISVAKKLPRKLAKADLQVCLIEDGRITIPLTINGEVENLMFDTGSSMFALITSEENANQISADNIIDSLSVNSWGNNVTVYGKKITSEVKFGETILQPSIVYYIKDEMFTEFFKQQNIWGIAGNAYFLNNIIIIDYKNCRFGIK